jgi:enoyl-CoA hydratase/carnithine racemase
MAAMGESTIRMERAGARVDIVLDRPARRNAVTQALAVELRDALLLVGADPSVGCVVLRGEGGAFCSGMDLGAAGPDLAAEPITAWTGVHAALYRCSAPVVVALERFAINAGASLVLAANLTVAGESSFLQVSEMAMGVAAPMCQAWLHLRHSPSVADRLTLGCDRVPAAELLRLGVVTEVVADDQVVEGAHELADRIAEYPPSGQRGVGAVWQRLRGTIDNPGEWFASLATGRP